LDLPNPWLTNLLAVCHDQAVMFLWTVFAYVSARVRVEVFFTLLTDRAFPSAELLGWFEHKPLWQRGQGACSGG
jgi:hypothetical protein